MNSLISCFSFLGRIADTIITCLIVIAIVFCIVMICKNEGSRKVFSYILGVVVIIVGIFSSIGLYKEVTARSYVNGTIDITNELSQRSFNYATTALVFNKNTYTNIYEYKVDLIPVTDFDGLDKQYEILLNNYYILNATIESGAISFNFFLDLYSPQNVLLCSGKLAINITFFSNRTQLLITTINPSEAQYFEQYFEDNGFSLKIKEKEIINAN